jgi:hypothetical protein
MLHFGSMYGQPGQMCTCTLPHGGRPAASNLTVSKRDAVAPRGSAADAAIDEPPSRTVFSGLHAHYTHPLDYSRKKD